MLTRHSTILALACTTSALVSAAAVGPPLEKRAAAFDGYYNASEGGGGWLTQATSDGLGEPLNVVVSNNSDPFILTEAGFVDWMWSIQYSQEFAGINIGGPQRADLGDGQGERNQTALLRYNYFDIEYGTLKESIEGGSHLRYWKQNGTDANSGAWFIAASDQFPANQGHMIIPNGYDIGRDVLLRNATMSNGTISPITNRTFSATAAYQSGFLPPNSSEGVNHGIPTDGRVAVLTVQVTSGTTTSANTTTTANVTTNSASAAPTPRNSASSLYSFDEATKVLLAGVVGSFALALLV